jgi:immune inhibitor A
MNIEAAFLGEPKASLVCPTPFVFKKLTQQLDSLRKSKGMLLSSNITFRERSPPGMDDGLIYPGNSFPLGTTAIVARSAAGQLAPPRGTINVIVVLVQFSDKAMHQTKKHFEEMLFSLGVVPTGSMREYYREVTNGLVDIVGQVVGPYTLPKKLTEYANNDYGTGNSAPNARNMAADASVAANLDVNFSQYDNNKDGYVDAFIVIHAGEGAEETANKDDIWSHKWVLPSPYNADGTNVYAYDTVPETAQIGVCAHELGHLLFGFPDLYDIDYSSSGIGDWCLMAGGSWNGKTPGQTPAHPCAFLKAKQGWVKTVTPKKNGTVSLRSVETQHTIYRLWKSGAPKKEYFLVENRQRVDFDACLPGDGILVWHIDEAITSNSDENHPMVALKQADAKEDLEVARNRGDAGDPYPGASCNNTFSNGSSPNSKSYGDLETHVSVTNIPNSSSTMKVKYTVC